MQSALNRCYGISIALMRLSVRGRAFPCVAFAALWQVSFAQPALDADYMDSCTTRFQQSVAFCQCSLAAFVKQETSADTAINTNHQRANREAQLTQLVASLAATLAKDPNVTEARIVAVCELHDTAQAQAEELPTRGHGRRQKIDRTKVDQAQLDEVQAARRNMSNEVHELLHEYAVNSNSYQLLFNGAICAARRDLAQLRAERETSDVAQEIAAETAPSDWPESVRAALAGGPLRHRDIAITGARADCGYVDPH